MRSNLINKGRVLFETLIISLISVDKRDEPFASVDNILIMMDDILINLVRIIY